jgi:hypothetical protein
LFDWKAGRAAPSSQPAKTDADLPIELSRDAQGNIVAIATQSGHYAWTTATGATRNLDVKAVAAPVALDGPWKVTFDPKLGGPDRPVTFARLDDWTTRSEEGIHYYSGVAVYRKTFEVSDASRPLEIDLGDVRSIARVRLNGREIATLWKAPYRIDVAAAVRQGKNALEIEVVNTWLNRLIGDDLRGAAKRVASATLKTWTGPVLPSGLLGPVTIRSAKKIVVPAVESPATE